MTATRKNGRMPGHARPLRILESFGEPRSTTNPYIAQLARSLDGEPGCEIRLFSFRGAIFASYDVFHVHWPEALYAGNDPIKGLVRELLTAIVLLRFSLGGKALVRTRHNVQPHSAMTRRQKNLDRWIDRLTTVNIRLNDVTVTPSLAPTVTILHGHYREWFASFDRRERIAGRVAFFGLIRPYKGVENLISAFVALQDPALSLSVSGQPSDPVLGGKLRELANEEAGIELNFNYVTDAELVEAVTQAELVVLPYIFMHNSGAALAALSLERPVLVPNTEVNRKLSLEVGRGWVYCFDGRIDARDIRSALDEHRADPPLHDPELQARSWEHAGAEHLRAFAWACRLHRLARSQAGAFLGTESEPSVGVRDE